MGIVGRAAAGRRRSRQGAAALVMALLLCLALVTQASAAAVAKQWQAKVGTGGVNGTATIFAYQSGSGAVGFKLAKMRAFTLLPVALRKGTCNGATLMTLGAVKSTGTGTVNASKALSASQVAAVKKATSGAGTIVLRVGSSTTGGVKCGVFAATAFVAANIVVGKRPHGIAVAPNGVWVANSWDDTLTRINPVTNSVVQTVPLTITGTGEPGGLAYGEGSIWVTVVDHDSEGYLIAGSLLRIDPLTGAQVATIPIDPGASGVAVSPGAVWVSTYGSVIKVDPATNAVVATTLVTGRPRGIAYGFDAIWVSMLDGPVDRLDPATGQIVATIATQATGAQIAVGPTGVWVTNPGNEGAADGAVTRIDPSTNEVVATLAVGESPWQVSALGGSVWVAIDSVGAPVLLRINAETNAILGRTSLPSIVYAMAATESAVWAVRSFLAKDATSEPPSGLVTKIAY